MSGSPALDKPPRSKAEIALEWARKALQDIAGDTLDKHTRDRANQELDRIRDLLNA